MKVNIVTIKNAQLGKSEALGFWAKHPEVMDAIYESGDDDYLAKDEDLTATLPADLSKLAISNRNLLVQIIQQAEGSAAKLDKALKSSLAASLGKVGNCLPTRYAAWGDSVRVEHLDGRTARHLRPMEFGWGYPTEDNKLWLDCWMWVPGGRIAERRTFEFLYRELEQYRMLQLRAAERLIDYRSGAIRLAAMPIESDEAFGVDLDALMNFAMNCFSWITQPRVNKLFELQKAD